MGLYTEEEFVRVQDYEQHRTDRNGMKFSRVILKFDLDNVRNRTLNLVLGRILKQLRMTDHIGWVNQGQIGIILPGTDDVGAKLFVRNTERILEGISGITVKLDTVYPLPEALMSAVSVSSFNNERTDITSEAEEVSILPFSAAN